MEQRSRRSVLKTGGALGVFGGLAGLGSLTGCAPPGGEGSEWTWSPEGSIPGTGTGEDPRWVWDDEADELVGSLLARGVVPEVNELLRGWTRNGQVLPDGLPADLRDFIGRARQLPAWTDEAKLVAAATFNQKRGLYLGMAYGFASGMMSTVIPHEARAVYYSVGGADMKDRIAKTAKLGYDVGTANAFRPDGEMIVTCVKTRLAHAAVRNLLPRSSAWSSVADEQIPISQQDLLVTWHSLPTTVAASLAQWKVPIPHDEAQGFLHSWQLTAHMLGFRDEYIPGSWADAKAQADQVLTPILGPTPEGKKLADELLMLGGVIDGGTFTRPLLGALTRYVLGSQIADWLEIPPDQFWDDAFDNLWEPFVAVREGVLTTFPDAKDLYWTFDEILRQGALWYLSTGRYPISIIIPTGNNPNIP
ncbi:MAG TPA: oxygenase MpaB family protein [Microthrixaceae bacterium]|nr:oxygenase MpaB family protein [Microthrixaceae bacterium]